NKVRRRTTAARPGCALLSTFIGRPHGSKCLACSFAERRRRLGLLLQCSEEIGCPFRIAATMFQQRGQFARGIAPCTVLPAQRCQAFAKIVGVSAIDLAQYTEENGKFPVNGVRARSGDTLVSGERFIIPPESTRQCGLTQPCKKFVPAARLLCEAAICR